ncbi:bifunctional N-acetylglucosamine-1-phosphate uridyltransferase/glucosamine-1-phosphate acetyltransferase [Roseobacter denitrificans]|uniref:Bifunctional protein GlmU n=1 Tax=Roseobacter denitrificans (strain ATCC 33942 / OCh 114) TaxID=375451 RepID=GLMU_ROSDO|nr:bifunctional UDP-N-acetylglucosamine diphosphorylase/glucosamine-1-phosphate N-acetyltransferase GlmU [Roseobacter denitrificans]Q163N8.1 RecName: Full=Bifunctional protein GlmU; Includes: RecName: Full=UDP-N-acetylglucosamine pyrophosphorylase; AltName: Full=N-acetylglucosamine-1-phosphate uridyltransferase; Includes: RecName: Full=Glucosamine-1-phosphate N-acetyltransferase [Roseobacter denitrificans OCh 114]ABG32805.1 UDP-N-acetylglucosamine pyrophosphorylase, putative [Roseobacter denitrif
MKTALVILAAGKGTRMNSDLPKVLHPLAGAPLLIHAMQSGASLGPSRTVIVAGHGAELVQKAALSHDASAIIVQQTEQLGTGHAAKQAQDALKGFDGTVVVLFGDTPFVSPDTLSAICDAQRSADVVVLGFEAADPARYGRLVMDGAQLDRIVEYKDATEAERAITLCNSGVVACNGTRLFELLEAVDNDNAAGEFYLPDIVGVARARGLTAAVVTCDESETLGINSRTELSAAEAAFQERARTNAFENGVTLPAPGTVHFAFDTVVGRDTLIEPNVVFGPGVTIESGATIRAFSHLEGCHVARGSVVGPYARLRPGAELSENVRVGNFVEVKNARIGTGTKINHLSYIGDATLGEYTNVGAGTITCNYDGVLKHHTEIGNHVFIGSNTMLVAPVQIGDHAMTGSGSVITSDVEPEALALSRAPQIEKPGMATKIINLLRAKKAKQQRGS